MRNTRKHAGVNGLTRFCCRGKSSLTMAFFFPFLVFCVLSVQHISASPLKNSKSRGQAPNASEGCIFHNVYNSGLSASQTQEILKRLKVVEQKLNKIVCKGPSKGKWSKVWFRSSSLPSRN